jgi:hypothetical protein
MVVEKAALQEDGTLSAHGECQLKDIELETIKPPTNISSGDVMHKESSCLDL